MHWMLGTHISYHNSIKHILMNLLGNYEFGLRMVGLFGFVYPAPENSVWEGGKNSPTLDPNCFDPCERSRS